MLNKKQRRPRIVNNSSEGLSRKVVQKVIRKDLLKLDENTALRNRSVVIHLNEKETKNVKIKTRVNIEFLNRRLDNKIKKASRKTSKMLKNQGFQDWFYGYMDRLIKGSESVKINLSRREKDALKKASLIEKRKTEKLQKELNPMEYFKMNFSSKAENTCLYIVEYYELNRRGKVKNNNLIRKYLKDFQEVNYYKKRHKLMNFSVFDNQIGKIEKPTLEQIKEYLNL